MEPLGKKVSVLEQMVMKTLYIQQQTEIGLQNLQIEMKEFKDEMKEFKDEMKEFKDEMKDFKDEMKKDRQDLNKKWGELANKMGTVIEDIVTPNIPVIAKKYFNCEQIDHLMVRTYKRTPDRKKGKEFDVIADCGDIIILNDTKSTPSVQYINDFIQELKENVLFEYFPEYSGKKVIPIFSSLSVREDLVKFLTKNKIFAMAMTGETMDLLNAKELL